MSDKFSSGMVTGEVRIGGTVQKTELDDGVQALRDCGSIIEKIHSKETRKRIVSYLFDHYVGKAT